MSPFATAFGSEPRTGSGFRSTRGMPHSCTRPCSGVIRRNHRCCPHRSAAVLWGLPHWCVAAEMSCDQSRWRRQVDRIDRATQHATGCGSPASGLRLTSVADTVVALAKTGDLGAGLAAADHALRHDILARARTWRMRSPLAQVLPAVCRRDWSANSPIPARCRPVRPLAGTDVLANLPKAGTPSGARGLHRLDRLRRLRLGRRRR